VYHMRVFNKSQLEMKEQAVEVAMKSWYPADRRTRCASGHSSQPHRMLDCGHGIL
jgi:hypothetical protein